MKTDPSPSPHLTAPAAERIYSLVIVEEMDQELLDTAFPAGTTYARREGLSWLAQLRADQSAMIGLLRRLHTWTARSWK